MSNQIFYISGNKKFYINENSGVLVLNNLNLDSPIVFNNNLFHSSQASGYLTGVGYTGNYDGGYFLGKRKISQNTIRLIDSSFGSTWVSKESSRQWTSISISSDGKYQSAVVFPGQIYVSSDHGNTWVAKESSRQWISISISSDGKYQSAVSLSEQIYVSSDYGNTWVAKESSRQWSSISISSDGKYQSAVVGNGQIYVSSDYGNTWVAKDSARGWRNISISSDGKYQSAVSFSEQIYVSSDYGNTWVAKESSRQWSSISISSDGKYQTAVANNEFVYISSDYGNTWVAKGSSRRWSSISISSDGKYQSAVVGNGQIYVSSDYGNTWVAKGSSRQWSSISISSDGKYQSAVSFPGQIDVSKTDELIDGNLYANNLVYNTGNQFISGTKIFTNPIYFTSGDNYPYPEDIYNGDGLGKAGGSIDLRGGDGGGDGWAGFGGSISLRGSDGNDGQGGNGGSISMNGAQHDGYAGSINTDGGYDRPGGSINTSNGGGSIDLRGGARLDSIGGDGGSISLRGADGNDFNGAGHGGSITADGTAGGGGGNGPANGGSLNMSAGDYIGAHGGSINTSIIGGSIITKGFINHDTPNYTLYSGGSINTSASNSFSGGSIDLSSNGGANFSIKSANLPNEADGSIYNKINDRFYIRKSGVWEEVITNNGNQTISGVKTFASRPTVNGTGVLLSGDIPYVQTNSYFYVDATRTDSYIENGNILYPYKTLSSAYNAAKNIASFNNPTYITLLSPIAENLTIDKGYINLVGNNTNKNDPIRITGSLVFAATGIGSTITDNNFSIAGLGVTATSNNKCILFSGNHPQRLFIQDCWLIAKDNGTCLYSNNTNTTSRLQGDILKLSPEGVNTTAIDIVSGTSSISFAETSSSASVLAYVRNNSTLNISNSQIETAGVKAFQVENAARLTLLNSVLTNTANTSTGIFLTNAGSTAVVVGSAISVPANANSYAINGVANSYLFYKNLYFSINAVGQSTESKIGNNINKNLINSYDPVVYSIGNQTISGIKSFISGNFDDLTLNNTLGEAKIKFGRDDWYLACNGGDPIYYLNGPSLITLDAYNGGIGLNGLFLSFNQYNLATYFGDKGEYVDFGLKDKSIKFWDYNSSLDQVEPNTQYNFKSGVSGSIPVDSEVVHKTGDETISGIKTFASPIYFISGEVGGGSITMFGNLGEYGLYPSIAGSIDLSAGVGGDGGSINLRGSQDADEGNKSSGGSIDLSAGAADGSPGGSIISIGGAGGSPGGTLNMSGGEIGGGGSITTSNEGGSITTSNEGGSINTSNGGGSINTEAGGAINTSNGGAINTSSAGGSISTANGGGSINTEGRGFIELGSGDTRTTLNGRALYTSNFPPDHIDGIVQGPQTINLPDTSGTLPIALISASTALNFGSINGNGAFADLTITLAGAVTTDVVFVTCLNGRGATDGQLIFEAFVSATDTVTVRAHNPHNNAINPASYNFRVGIIRIS